MSDIPHGTDWRQASLGELADHIVATHHAYTRRALGAITWLLGEAINIDGPRHPEIALVKSTFRAMDSELVFHLLKEEQMLFPMLRQMEASGEVDKGKLSAVLAALEAEHQNGNKALARLRELTHGFVAPEDASGQYREIMERLEGLEEDMRDHVWKEDDVMFPKVRAMAGI